SRVSGYQGRGWCLSSVACAYRGAAQRGRPLRGHQRGQQLQFRPRQSEAVLVSIDLHLWRVLSWLRVFPRHLLFVWGLHNLLYRFVLESLPQCPHCQGRVQREPH
ncbi:hypothetical protein FOZ63_024307, partial [Perkinsus olseni]